MMTMTATMADDVESTSEPCQEMCRALLKGVYTRKSLGSSSSSSSLRRRGDSTDEVDTDEDVAFLLKVANDPKLSLEFARVSEEERKKQTNKDRSMFC